MCFLCLFWGCADFSEITEVEILRKLGFHFGAYFQLSIHEMWITIRIGGIVQVQLRLKVADGMVSNGVLTWNKIRDFMLLVVVRAPHGHSQSRSSVMQVHIITEVSFHYIQH